MRGELCMLEGIQVLCHSSIRMKRDMTIYFDPFQINHDYNDADIILITHDHYDHYSEEDIDRVVKKDTIIVAPMDLKEKLLNHGFQTEQIVLVEPNQNYQIKGIEVHTIPAYNTNKAFHKKEYGWVGYLIMLDGITYYIAGDTDITEENLQVRCDVAFVPVGGTYAMTYGEAASLVNQIHPKIAVPIHYGSIVGTKEDGKKFSELLDSDILCKVFIS